MRRIHSRSGLPRRGVILLVVVLMLALFLVVGLSFVFYSQSQADASRINREAQSPDPADILPETLLSWGLGQFIYPVPDDSASVFSAMRGHELSRLMWGWDYLPVSNGPYSASNPLQVDPSKSNYSFDPTYGSLANTTAFNGLGRLRTLPAPSGITGVSEFNMVNFTWYPSDGFVRDPERPGTRTDANQPLNPFAGGFNVPYTYPDQNNMFLAVVQADDQTSNHNQRLIAQSYFRPTQGLTYAQIDPTTSNGQAFWNTPTASASPALKYMVLRPRPGDQLLTGETMYQDPTTGNWLARNAAGISRRAFPPPQDAGGDVKQLEGVPFVYFTKNANGQMVPVQTQNDSFWMDLNYPVQITRNGRKFKPLFAFLVLDLDGKINLNMHGNIAAGQAPNYQHASNQGLGRYEVNVSKLLVQKNPVSRVVEWPLLFTGAGSASTVGRYGVDQQPGTKNGMYPDPYAPDPITNSLSWRSLIHPFDFDGVDSTTRLVTTKFTLPLSPNAQGQPYFGSYPTFVAAYDNYKQGTQQTPLLNHPFLSQRLRYSGDDMPLTDDNMYYLLANDYRKSYLYSLIPTNLGGDGSNSQAALASAPLGNRNRYLLTTRSYDLDAPGASPWVTTSANSQYTFAGMTGLVNSTQGNYPTGQPMPTPAPGTGATQMDGLATQAAKTNDYSDFKANDGRGNLLSRIDLNRKLTSYNDANGLFNGGQPVPPPPANAATLRSQFPLAANPQYRYYYATFDRQQMAMDIFNRLVQATGARSPDVAPVTSGATTLVAGKLGSLHQSAATPATAQNYNATRWLAQLAVNIVDYIDDDDIITPFNWNPAPDTAIANGDTGWVFGVEAPKLVINEAYCELQNDPTDQTAAISGAKLPFEFSFWLELYNPMPAPVSPTTNQPTAITASNLATLGRPDPNKVSQFIKMPQDQLAVQLQRQSTTLGNYPVYQVQMVDESANPPTSLASASNTDGSITNPAALRIQVTSLMPDMNANANAPANAPTPYPDYTFVQPTIGAFNIPTTAGGPPSNTGFYVMGPDSKHPFVQTQQAGGTTLRPTINLQDQGATPQVSSQTPWGQPADPNTGAPGKAENAMTYKYQGNIPATSPQTIAARTTHTVLLRRLACPNLDPNPLNPQTKMPVNQNAPYNPYVTVDFITGLPTHDAVEYTSQRPFPPNKPNNQDFKQPSQRYSMGRVQPYNAAVLKQQQSIAPNPVNNTFFSHNSQTLPAVPSTASTANNQPGQGPTLDWPFDWLTFADRPLTNVTEVMNVPSTPPHLLTQAFGYNALTKKRDPANHLAPWGIQDARIYRALEYFAVGDRSPYPGTGGRLAGKVNVNTVFDQPIIDAVVDAQPNSNFFTEQAINDIWYGLDYPQQATNTTIFTDTNNNGFLNRKQTLMGLGTNPDRPFMSFAAPVAAAGIDPQYPTTAFPTGVGIQNTILPYPIAAAAGGQPTPGGTFMPQTWSQGTPPGKPSQGVGASFNYAIPANIGETTPPPFIMNELLTKITGHTTVRSNTFAVFLTVGFFEVIDDTTLPVKLGAEITTSSGKAIRHQMFSIVDRTNLALAADPNPQSPANNPSSPLYNPNARLQQASTPPIFMSVQESVPPGTTTQTLTIQGGIPIDYDGSSPVVFSQGQTLFLDTGRNQEWVTVQSVNTTLNQITVVWPTTNKFSVGHPGGAMLSNYQPGNPGPQGAINYASPQYKAVVPYTYIIQ
jgi:hypothetical protein